METITVLALACFILGAVIGSFLGVCAYRIPMGKYEPTREGIRELAHPVSIVTPPRSFCPQCEKPLLWWHMIPVISWFILRGRCAYCAKNIPLRYPLIELLTGTLCALCLLRFGPTATAAVAFVFIALLIVITYIDLDYMIIPDVITYPATIAGMAISIMNRYLATPFDPILAPPFVNSPLESFLGLLAGPGVLLFVWWLYFKVRRREGLGLGDVKLLAVVGATFGAECAWFTMFIGSVIGALVGIAMLITSRRSIATYIPFGPYLAFATIAYLLDAQGIVAHLLDPSITSNWWIARNL